MLSPVWSLAWVLVLYGFRCGALYGFKCGVLCGFGCGFLSGFGVVFLGVPVVESGVELGVDSVVE